MTETAIPKAKRPAMRLLIDTVRALQREDAVMYSSLIKDTMKRKQPSFSEGTYGYRTFSNLLEDAEKMGVIHLRTDQRSGTYVVTGFAEKAL